ncbi:MAG: histidine kinase, partial [Candidatus Omnitrophota bacterium]
MKWIKPEIPGAIMDNWQKSIDLITAIMDVPVGLITKIYPLQVEILLVSNATDNPYQKGQRFNLDTDLYCESVISRRDQILIPNAEKDQQWTNSY